MRGHGSPVVKVSDSGWRGMSSKRVPLKTRRVGAMHVKSVESSNVLSLVWQLGVGRMLAQVTSSSLDHGSKLRSPSTKALM
ncbi:hypothetical protein TNCV_1663281 [Trichonephila clavipes]|nr:hypothetical protein TNCV_1663281 [Trichonephila clavipes]